MQKGTDFLGPYEKPIVLVVDDNKDLADTTAEILRLHKYEVQTALCIKAARKLIVKLQRPAVVLLDKAMDGEFVLAGREGGGTRAVWTEST